VWHGGRTFYFERLKMGNTLNTGKYWDFGWQLIEGCTPCSPGCLHCWSLAKEKRFRKETGVVFHSERLERPLNRKKPAVYSIWNDLFHPGVSFEQIDKTLDVINVARQHTFLILTKRPDRMYEYFESRGSDCLHSNLYPGLTICNQQEADEKIRILVQIQAAYHWLSIEPLLGPIELAFQGRYAVIIGCESGPVARPCKLEWIQSIVDQCEAAGVKCFVKQCHIPKWANGNDIKYLDDCIAAGDGFRISHNPAEWPDKLRERKLIWQR
jgi:protein gp37